MSLPTLHGEGRLIADPELRWTTQGTAVAKIRLAFNQRKKDANGEWQDGDTFFVTGTLFRVQAENAAEAFSKGDSVIVRGRLKTETWETKDGEKRSVTGLLVDAIGKIPMQPKKTTPKEKEDDPWEMPEDATPF